jgi:ligand-binding SRPBCC domain-containing protein
MRHSFHAEQWVPQPIDRIFAFFANPENLPRLTPSAQRIRIEEASFAPPPPPPTGVVPRVGAIIAGPGTRLTLGYRPIPHFFARLPWELEITSFEWNDHFTDLQLRGPFAYWSHTHSFSEETRANANGTLTRDDIEYEVPYGKLGELAQPFIARQLSNTFATRRDRLRILFGGIAGT